MTLLDGPEPGATEVTIWDLEMASAGQLRPGRAPDVDPVLLVAEQPAPELCRFFYQLVGGPWHWVDHLPWSLERWVAWCERPGFHLVTCWVDGVPAGYYEFEEQGSRAEIIHFGLVERFFGRGLGGWLLADAVNRAFATEGIETVGLNTCSLDGPSALDNYRARGFEVVGQRTQWRRLDGPGHDSPVGEAGTGSVGDGPAGSAGDAVR